MIDHHIRRLQVAEDDGLRFVPVQIGQHVAQLDGPINDLRFGQEAGRFGEDRLQILAVNEFHHQVGPILMCEGVVYFGDGWMVEGGQQVRLALEVLDYHLPQSRVGGEIQHFLDRHQLADVGKVHVASLVHGPHAADAQHTQNLIAALQDRTGLEVRVVGQAFGELPRVEIRHRSVEL